MAEKTFLTVDLYDNVLTEKSNDYTGKVSITGTIHNTDIADCIVKARTEFRPETIVTILGMSDEIKVAAIAEGKSVVDGVGQWLLNFSGPLEGEKPAFDATKHKFGVTFTPGRALLKLLKQLTANFRVATTGPVVNDFTDSASKLVSQQITPNSPAIITGSNLLIKGDNPSVGIYFTPDGADKTPVKVDLIVANTTSQIIIQVPNLPDGQYLLSVTTQAGSGYSLVKEPRTYQFPILLTVGNQPGGGGSDRPEIE